MDAQAQSTIDRSSPEYKQLDSSTARKRSRGNERESIAYPRRRAVTACSVCRVRKIKCTNERPACTSCVRAGSRCSYDDSKVDHSSFDPASLVILERLDELLRRLPPQGLAPSQPSLSVAEAGLVSPQSTGTQCVEALDSPDADPLCTFSSVECLLMWPIWGDSQLTTADEVSDAVFTPAFEGIWTRNTREDDLPHGPEMRSSLLQINPAGQELKGFIQDFLLHVHSRNPFLDIDHLRRCVSVLAELGPSWDPPSCLVLLAAALGVISKSLSSSAALASQACQDTKVWATADAYYHAARIRFGLLDPNIISAQCYVLSGLYWIYRLRPLQAGQDFARAGVMYMNHRKHREALTRSEGQQIMEYTSNERRTYWTCVRLESEIDAELRAPNSGIAKTPCADAFPPPPESVTNRACSGSETYAISPVSDQRFISTQQGHASIEQATAWYYSLTETSLRRTIDQILDVFYRSDHASWLARPVSLLVKNAHSFEEQLSSWMESLPPEIQFTGPAAELVCKNEHRFVLRQRYAYICSLLYRPFLYIAVHSPSSACLPKIVIELAHKAIRHALALNDDIGARYRFEGTWAMCRLAGANILLLCAAKKARLLSQSTLLAIGREWGDLTTALEMDKVRLKYWSQESVDLRVLTRAVEERYALAFGSSQNPTE
ncbi:fungal specific transcription factor domain-containing protein [Stagonosporopsis vannaccii]|nr:fungal specific transcription factor domain-containing protein [Stagonosporopsis vannaccii]